MVVMNANDQRAVTVALNCARMVSAKIASDLTPSMKGSSMIVMVGENLSGDIRVAVKTFSRYMARSLPAL